ncbi:XAC0095 family protein [Pseudoxanthomonas sacheonensis]|uniref:XAC0095 family protein n=1 Tax=Pseudoxanthomonas sacheonensis TaxID=443615 RepID=UPI003CCE122B
MPEEAHQQLQCLCQHLHLLAELSQPEILNPDHLILPRAGLTHCFNQLAEAADRIVAGAAFRSV